MRRTLFVLLLVLAPTLGGCHQQSPGGSGSVKRVITQDEIDGVGASNIYDVIVRLHAEFLNDRGRTSILQNKSSRAVVFLNDQEYGIPETMRNIPTNRIAEVRHYPGTEAVARYGAQYGGGVILLISRVY